MTNVSKFDDEIEAAATRTRDIARRIVLTDAMLDTATRARREAEAVCMAVGFNGGVYLRYAIAKTVEQVLLDIERERHPDWLVRTRQKDPERYARSRAEEGL